MIWIYVHYVYLLFLVYFRKKVKIVNKKHVNVLPINILIFNQWGEALLETIPYFINQFPLRVKEKMIITQLYTWGHVFVFLVLHTKQKSALNCFRVGYTLYGDGSVGVSSKQLSHNFVLENFHSTSDWPCSEKFYTFKVKFASTDILRDIKETIWTLHKCKI